MAIIQNEYSGTLEDLDKNSNFKIIAPGRYPVIISGESIKDTSARNGKILTFDVQIVDGEYKGSVIWDNFNIINPNAITVKISEDRLARISVIVNGTPSYKRDTINLHNKLMMADIDTDSYTDREGKPKIKNIIKQYHPKHGEFKDLLGGKKSTTTASAIDDSIPFF